MAGICLLFFFASYGYRLERCQVQDLARPAIIDSCACLPLFWCPNTTHSLTGTRTHRNPLGHRHWADTQHAGLGLSYFLIYFFFCFPNQLRVIVSSYLDWCFALKTKKVVLLMGSKRSSQVSRRLAPVISDSSYPKLFSRMAVAVVWPIVFLRICSVNWAELSTEKSRRPAMSKQNENIFKIK